MIVNVGGIDYDDRAGPGLAGLREAHSGEESRGKEGELHCCEIWCGCEGAKYGLKSMDTVILVLQRGSLNLYYKQACRNSI